VLVLPFILRTPRLWHDKSSTASRCRKHSSVSMGAKEHTMAHHPGRNDACPCGSGKKYKKCCELKQQNHRGNNLLLIVVGLLMAAGVVAGITAFTTERGHVGRTQGVWSPEHGHYH
jgi:hypothetical protein